MGREIQYGSYLIVPLKYEKENPQWEWLKQYAVQESFTTMDINESVKQTINSSDTINVIWRYRIAEEVLRRELFGETVEASDRLYARNVNHSQTEVSGEEEFQLKDSYIYIFHTKVAFLCLGISYENMRTLREICNLGYADSRTRYYIKKSHGEVERFSLDEKLEVLCRKAGLSCFFQSGSSMFLEAYVYTLALLKGRFQTLEEMRKITFNLHLMTSPEEAVEDESEEDVRYVYAAKDQKIGSYRWGCCVSSQTISYAVGDRNRSLDDAMKEQGEDGLPVTLLALYQKYTCLRFTELLAIMDKKKASRLRQLKKQMLEFRAYGMIAPANISRWHNVKQIYRHVVETNGIPEATEDIVNTLNILSEHQKEIETARNDAVVGIITVFGIVSILASILTIIQILSGGGSVEWLVTIVSVLSMLMIVALMVMWRKKD